MCTVTASTSAKCGLVFLAIGGLCTCRSCQTNFLPEPPQLNTMLGGDLANHRCAACGFQSYCPWIVSSNPLRSRAASLRPNNRSINWRALDTARFGAFGTGSCLDFLAMVPCVAQVLEGLNLTVCVLHLCFRFDHNNLQVCSSKPGCWLSSGPLPHSACRTLGCTCRLPRMRNHLKERVKTTIPGSILPMTGKNGLDLKKNTQGNV